jgi:hypothetical protein
LTSSKHLAANIAAAAPAELQAKLFCFAVALHRDGLADRHAVAALADAARSAGLTESSIGTALTMAARRATERK